MRVLTIRRDYAEQIIDGIKKIENRSWGKRVCGQVAIHAGGKGGAIIGIVEIEDVVDTKTALKMFPDQAKFIFGPLCWVIKNVKKLKNPIVCKGKLSLWTISDSLIQP